MFARIGRFYRNGSIKRKLTTISLLVCGITLTVSGASMISLKMYNERAGLMHSTTAIAEVISKQSVDALRKRNADAARDILRSVENIQQISSVCLYDGNGSEFVRYTHSAAISAKEACPHITSYTQMFDWDYFTLSVPIRNAEGHLGALHVRTSLDGLYRKLTRDILFGVTIILFALMGAYFLFERFQRTITQAITELFALVTIFSSTKNYALRARAHERDELGQLGEAFNSMLITMEENESELVMASQQAEAAMRKAADANRMKGEFLANMSHEIRTPMNGIMGMTELLLETRLNHKQHNYARTVSHSAEALLTIINDILDFSKIESGKLHLEPIPFDLNNVVEDTADLLAIKAHEKALELIVRYVPNTPQQLIGDPGRIRQILHNLAGNAIKFTKQGFVAITVEQCESRFAHIGDNRVRIRISVEDTGIGIPSDVQEHIFDKFSQADASTTRKFGGTGLGLAISKQLSEMMGGRIGVYSAEGEGSTFWFEMELRVAESNTDGAQNVQPLAGLRALIIDDIAINGALLKEQLTKMGMQPMYVSDAQAAMEVLEDAAAGGRPFDMVLLDHSLPNMQAEELAKAIRFEFVTSKPLLCVMAPEDYAEYSERLLEAGFDVSLAKPVKPYELRHLLPMAWQKVKEGLNGELLTREHLQVLEHEADAIDTLQFAGASVLLVEDNRINRAMASEILSEMGLIVHEAYNGRLALEALEEKPFDLVLMDCQMPELDGFEATRFWRRRETEQERAAIPIIALTANAMKGDREKCLEAGMNDYLAKPFKKEELQHVLAHWMQSKATSTAQPKASPELLDEIVFSAYQGAMGTTFDAMLGQQLQHMYKLLEGVEQAHARDDLKMLGGLAYSLQALASALGMNELAFAASALEEEARNQQIAGGKAGNIAHLALERLRRHYEETCDFVRQYVAVQEKHAV